MEELTKKRLKAIMIDLMIANGVEQVIEPILKKKVKKEFFHVMVTQSLVFWGLEYIQLKSTGQTAGQRLMGIQIVSDDGGELSSKQIIYRILHRDFVSPTKYWRNREMYKVFQGARFPHDVYAGTETKDV